MIELVHAKLTHTYAATRRPSGMHVGRASVSLSVFSDLFEPPEEGKGIGFPRKHVILADCTTMDCIAKEPRYQAAIHLTVLISMFYDVCMIVFGMCSSTHSP